MRLIDADKLKMSFKPYFDGKKTIGQIIDEQPTVEAQPTDMRDATEEERKSVKNYIESISKPTGLHFYEAQPTDAEREAYIKGYDYGVKDWFKSKTQPCEERIVEWKKDFKEYVSLLTMPRDDYNGIMEYIDEFPSVTPRTNLAETSQDCISREQAIKQCGFGMTSLLIADNLRRLPSVKPQRPKGKWIEVNRGIHVTDYRCSECGRIVRDDTGYDVSADYPYCHCGAEMGGAGCR